MKAAPTNAGFLLLPVGEPNASPLILTTNWDCHPEALKN
jgi:hypothetical protein